MTRLRAVEPRRLVLPAGAVALTAIVVVVALVIVSSGEESVLYSGKASRELGTTSSEAESAEAAEARGGEEAAAESGGGTSSAGGSAEAGGEPVYESEPSAAPSSGESAGRPAQESGPYAAGAKHRSVERAAEITLGTAPEEVGKASGEVLETVHAYDGIVLDSSTSGGSEGAAGARFTLLIPSAKLDDALAAFSEIAEVRSRHEASKDITAPTVTTGEQLQDSHARVESLLNQLEGAETEAEQEAVEAKLRAERRQQARLKSQLSALRRRANLSRVSLKIVSDEAPASGGGGWDAGSALHDAGRILSVAAGVVIVGLAALAPLALLALLAWLAHRAWLRGRRERALG